MFDELNKILSEDSSEDSWYDDGCIYAKELLGNFTDDDWEKLMTTIKSKNDKYKIRLAYSVEEDTGMNGFNLLLELLDEDDEVAEYAIDSLRSFDGEPYRNLIISDKSIIDKAENLLKNASLPVKRILEMFLQQNK
ncbi:hypothetical protein NRP46_001793 [Listeria monocytogenes]|nr:hypothetical protein [Listeria monocytogenes]EJG4318431.1 hypothetical protein [Listeria monocytogenes]EJG4321309.1 hypothetical protein [Listeria monocytogenes]EJG4344998.1 hypothetical protein [Listeria monocytogenes]EJG6008193.1 hypothetical protein [Listeria monocytogenes]